LLRILPARARTPNPCPHQNLLVYLKLSQPNPVILNEVKNLITLVLKQSKESNSVILNEVKNIITLALNKKSFSTCSVAQGSLCRGSCRRSRLRERRTYCIFSIIFSVRSIITPRLVQSSTTNRFYRSLFVRGRGKFRSSPLINYPWGLSLPTSLWTRVSRQYSFHACANVHLMLSELPPRFIALWRALGYALFKRPWRRDSFFGLRSIKRFYQLIL